MVYQPRSWCNGYDLGEWGLLEIYEGDMQVHLVGVASEEQREAAVQWWLSKIETSRQMMQDTARSLGVAGKGSNVLGGIPETGRADWN